ncbi:conserved hypothetical protein [Ixodes scapularis]|uniref:Uncharacterized protein n=1 Tax=Ixodes scapularis TaxID=6945 RepID=B7PAX1_IXOSC|nr:conserved hypothetical protein [Ixodes scapularis]|eukprot:XP_002407358.1 conserved hypothetical protein [Ixodes scapularis]
MISGYVLADNKYDVWLGNTRGNTYGKRHKRYSPKSRRFWNFSFHEHAKYDAPAQIDYILNVTNRKSLLYVKAFAGLAPFNKLAHMIVPPLELAAPFAESFLRAVNAAGQYEVLAQGSPFMPIARRFCSLITSRIVCSLIGDTLTNYGSRYINELVKSKKPQKFDYGEEINQEYYGQRRPPLYKLANVKTDVGIFWSKGDEFVPPENVKILIKELGSRVKKNHYIDDPYYTHLHFAIALVNPKYLYPDLLEFLGRYRSP